MTYIFHLLSKYGGIVDTKTQTVVGKTLPTEAIGEALAWADKTKAHDALIITNSLGQQYNHGCVH